MPSRTKNRAQIHPLLSRRWSPYVFDPHRDVSAEDLRALFEAARSTMSSYNEQPWRYIVGIRSRTPTIWKTILGTLDAGNQRWAQHAPVLAVGLAHCTFERNGRENTSALHDLGAASASMTFEATSRQLHVHQMAGVDTGKIAKRFSIKKPLVPHTGLAIGYAGDPTKISEEYADRDSVKRPRRPLTETIICSELE